MIYGNALETVNVRAASSTGGLIEIHLDKADGPLLAQVKIGKNSEWQIISAKLQNVMTDVHNLFVIQKEKNNVDLDWVNFE